MDKSDNKNVKNKEDLKKAEYKGHREELEKDFWIKVFILFLIMKF